MSRKAGYQPPSISVLIPTLNSQRVLGLCLKSITSQKYPQSKVEIIVADGGSMDNTLKIARSYGAKIYNNKLRTGESGKAEALKHARNEIIALIDSDNILPDNNWFTRLTEPFIDKGILGSEPWEYTYREKDTLVNRYCSLMGMNDPYCYFVGNYDRKNILSGLWSGVKLKQEDLGDYLKVDVNGNMLPTIGANGTLWRKEVLKKAVGNSDYLFDTDIPYTVIKQRGAFGYAKVKIGIIHLYCHQVKDFIRKQRRRARDFLYLEKKGKRNRTFQSRPRGQLTFILSTLLIIPLLFQSIKGFRKHPDLFVWLFHPVACWITLLIYTGETLESFVRSGEMSRSDWKQ